MNRLKFAWRQVLNDTGEVDSGQFGGGDSRATLTILFDDGLRWEAIRNILGYSYRTDKNTLARRLPAQHPEYPWLYATRILNLRGEKAVEKTAGRAGDFALCDTCRMTIQFETLPYAVKADSEVSNKEYKRFVDFRPKPGIENIQRPGRFFKFVDGPAVATTFPYPYLIRAPKQHLSWRWVDVPDAYLNNRQGLPINLLRRIGTVNNGFFPAVGPGGYPPETLLMLEPELTPKQLPIDITEATSAVEGGVVRTWDVTLNFVYFDPPVPAGYVTGRGHNVLPPPPQTPPVNYFYLATIDGTARGARAYPRSNFEILFQAADRDERLDSEPPGDIVY